MTQTVCAAAREAVYQILREAVRLGMELRPKTLRSGAALLYERTCESLIPLRKVKQLQRRRIALDTAITLCVGHAGTRNRERDFTPHARHFRVSRGRALFTSRPRASGLYGCVRIWVCPPPALSDGLAVHSLKRPFPGVLSQRKPVPGLSCGSGTRTIYRQVRVAVGRELPTEGTRSLWW